MSDQNENDSYQIVIVECCQNCQSHQTFARHSQWKYFEQFNELKRKLQKFVNNVIVVKNPIPDQLVKPADSKVVSNQYINKQTKQSVLFPRIGAFQIYIYNVLISSKLLNNSWPNHYKIIQLVTKIIQAKKKGQSLQQYSVFQNMDDDQDKGQKQILAKSLTKKKKNYKDFRVYKSKQKSLTIQPIKQVFKEVPVRKRSIVVKQVPKDIDKNKEEPQSGNKKSGRRTLLDKQKNKQSSLDIRTSVNTIQMLPQSHKVKLPSLKNGTKLKQSISQRQQKGNQSQMINRRQRIYSMKQQKQSKSKLSTNKLDKKIQLSNSIQTLQKNDISRIQMKPSAQGYRMNSFILQANQSADLLQKNQSRGNLGLKFLQDKSVQLTQKDQKDYKQFMNRQIQYEEQQGFYCDFGLQANAQEIKAKDMKVFQVQTQKVQFYDPKRSKKQVIKKPQMISKQTQANIIIPKFQKFAQTQTIPKQYTTIQINTQPKPISSKACQFPQQNKLARSTSKILDVVVDQGYIHLSQKKKNIIDNNYYSIDRFEQKSTKYKWIGRADQKYNLNEINKKLMLECLVFYFYNYFGIKTSQKRLILQTVSNVQIEDKNINVLPHVITLDNPQLKYLDQFYQYNNQQMKYPLSQILTFKANNQSRKFNKYGKFLALAYFISDTQLYDKQRQYFGVEVSNGQVQDIIKICADQYQIPNGNFIKEKIVVQKNRGKGGGIINIERISEEIQKQFISTLAKIIIKDNFEKLLRSFQNFFVNGVNTNKPINNTLKSLKTDKIDRILYQEFIEFLKQRKYVIQNNYVGQMYAFQKYGTLNPKITFSLQNYKKKNSQNLQKSGSLDKSCKQGKYIIQRKFLSQNKTISRSDIQKFVKKDTILIITGQAGSGKTTVIQQINKNLITKYGQKIKIKNITKNILTNQNLFKKKIEQIAEETIKQTIFIDDAQFFLKQSLRFIQRIFNRQDRKSKVQISVCLILNDPNNQKIRVNTNNAQVVQCNIIPISIQEIRGYLMKNILYFNHSQKKTFTQQLLGPQNINYTQNHPKNYIVKLLKNPFYLKLYCAYINHVSNILDENQTFPHNLNRYFLLKQAYIISYNRHADQCQHLHNKFSDCFNSLRKIAFQYYLNNDTVNQVIKQTIQKLNTNQVITNQLAFYPINLNALLLQNKNLFFHQQYLYYFIVQAYSFYLQKAFKNLNMNKLYENQSLFSLFKQRYTIQKAQSNLLKVIQSSRKFKSISQQSSNAMTVLNKISSIFSNMNLDQVQIPQADLTQGVFYNCSFKNTNMSNTILYKSQLINCGIQGAILDNVNLFQRKYDIEYTVLSASLSMDGKYIALGCGNYLIIVQADSGKESKKIQAHMDIIRTVKYSKDGTTLITIADDKTLRIWDTHTYKSVVFKLPQKGTIAFSSQTDMIASVIKSSLKVWNIKSMANQFTFQGHSDLITCLQFSNQGKFIATGSKDNTIRIWSTKKSQVYKIFKGHSAEINTVRISPNSSVVVSSSKNKDIIVWGFQNGSQICKTKFEDQVNQICLDEKQKFVVISLAKQNIIRILLLQTLQLVFKLQGHNGRILSLNFDNNYRKLISLGKDKAVKIWQFNKIIQIQYAKFLQNKKNKLKISQCSILGLAYDKINNKYATSNQIGQINIYSGINNKFIDQLISHQGPVRCLAYDKQGKLYSGGSNGIVKVWNLQVKRQPKTYDLFTSQIIQLKLNQKNRIIAMSSVNNQLVVVDFTGITIILTSRQQGRVQSIQFNRDQKIMAVGGSQKSISIYKIGENGKSVTRVEQLGPNSDSVVCMTFQGDAYLVAALKNSQISIWNHLRSTLVKKIENPSPITYLLTFQKKYVCFSSEDGKLRVIDMEQGKQAKVFRVGEKCTKFITNANQSLLYETTDRGNIVIWNLGSLKQTKQKVQFDKVAFDEQGKKMIQIEGPRQLLTRDLQSHNQQIVKVKDISCDIDGVTFYRGKAILRLKNGVYWELGEKQFNFGTQMEVIGDMFWMKDKSDSSFFKTPIKKTKGIRKPILAVLEDISS